MYNFDFRSDDEGGLMVFDTLSEGESISMDISIGCEVTLKVDDEELVVSVESVDDETYEGTVIRFIGDVEGQIGDQVEFSLCHVWEISRA